MKSVNVDGEFWEKLRSLKILIEIPFGSQMKDFAILSNLSSISLFAHWLRRSLCLGNTLKWSCLWFIFTKLYQVIISHVSDVIQRFKQWMCWICDSGLCHRFEWTTVNVQCGKIRVKNREMGALKNNPLQQLIPPRCTLTVNKAIIIEFLWNK